MTMSDEQSVIDQPVADAPPKPKQRKGFAVMSRKLQKELAARGGRAAHAKGVAHQWTSEEARAAGRKGGATSRRPMQNGATSGEHWPAVRAEDKPS
jgi:uncharacterized protein